MRLLSAGLVVLASIRLAVGAERPCQAAPTTTWEIAVQGAAATAAPGVHPSCDEMVGLLESVASAAPIEALSSVEDDPPFFWLFNEIRAQNCCAAMAPAITLCLRNARDEPILASHLTWLVSELACADTADPLIALFDSINACRVGPDFAAGVTLALGRNGGPAARKRLREHWRAPTTRDCDGGPAIDPDILAAALVLSGDPEALPWLLSALDERSRRQYLPEQHVVASGLARLPEAVRRGQLPSLLARMRDRSFAAGLAEECVKAGCFRTSPLARLPGDH